MGKGYIRLRQLRAFEVLDSKFTNALLKKQQSLQWSAAVLRKSKLELYEDVLSALANKYYLSVDSLAFECNMDCMAANERLEFLMKNSLVKKNHINKKVLYSLTARGEAIYKTLAITKRLKKLKESVKTIGEALNALPAVAEQNEENAKQPRRDENY